MALRAVTDHPKFSRLKMLLKLNKSCALGYLEALWHFCGKYTPQGNVGKYSDADIEAWLEWDGEEGALIAACVKAGWLGVDETYRLIVHDWSQYADEIVHTDLGRRCLLFADGVMPKTGRLNKYERERFHAAFPEGKPAENSHGSDIPDLFDDACQTESDSAQTKSAKAQTKPDFVTKPEPEPAEVQIPPLPPASGGALRAVLDVSRERSHDNGEKLSSEGWRRGECSDCVGGQCTMNCGPCAPTTDEDRAELAEVNAMRARMKPVPLPPLTWAVYGPNRNHVASGATRPGGRRPRVQRLPRSPGYEPRAPV